MGSRIVYIGLLLHNERTAASTVSSRKGDKRSSVAWPSSRFIVLSLAERGGSGLHSAAQG